MAQKVLHFVAGEDFELPELPGRALPSRSYTETYYDTAGGRLDRAGFTLRRRVENGKGVWHLTVTSDGASALDVEALGGPAAPPAELQELLSAASAGFALTPVAKLSTKTNGKRVKRGSHTLARVQVSSVAVLDGRRVTEAFHELVLEPLAADRKELGRLEKALRRAGAKPGHASAPVARALGSEALDESPAATPDLERLRMFFREQFARMLAHDPGVRLGEDPEELHQLRVATRRLRSVLRTASPLLEATWAQALRDELSWLGDELGVARDIDVLTEHLRAEAADLDPADRRALKPLFDDLAAEGKDARSRVLEALRSERYFALLATARGRCRCAAGRRRRRLARKAARKEFDRAGQGDGRARGRAVRRGSASGSHQGQARPLRRRAPRGRRWASAGKRLIAAAKAFQDVAGEHQDAVVAEERIRKLAARQARRSAPLSPRGSSSQRERERRARPRPRFPTPGTSLDKAAAKAWA